MMKIEKPIKSKILIIVPAYNEEASIAKTVSKLAEETTFDVLVIDDGSTDRTQKILKGLEQKFPKQVASVRLAVNSGIGAAVQTGFLYAERNYYDYAVQYDGDGQHDIESLQSLVAACISGGYELCIGSRFLGNRGGFQSTPLRRVGIFFFSRLISTFMRFEITDPTSGFRVYGKKALHHFAHHYPDDYPEPECVVYCLNNGLPVGECPVRMIPRFNGESSIGALHSIYYMVKVTLGILFEWSRFRVH